MNKSFDPTKARQLFNEVQEEYKEKNPQANHEAQIKLLLPKPEKEIENMVYSYLKQSLESVFTNSNLEIIISDEEYCDFILNIGDVYYNNVTNRLAFIFNLEKVNEESRNIVIDLNNDPLVEVFRKKYANNDDWKTYFFDKITSNNELIFNIGEFVDFIEKTYLVVSSDQTLQENQFFLKILKQIEMDNFQNMNLIPLLNKNKVRVYSDLNKDFTNSFLLGFFH
ncbi:hypothetical protein ['Catharanthus roseus' aster yellows phytoplasma]|uniref:Uncharacterized protein n=1 Tax='Catharanthus roseus' aster yellows phytoplasma TaxID=1193712 RepID=A0A4V0Z8W3_9MOLU|nr:hypothetical protein ['Catharanthus roseus' aster yellows phytoplasma]QBF23666.1 hypothetical protein EXT02_00245 ['Catharanthus roseus' aster yellows phytoplasma]